MPESRNKSESPREAFSRFKEAYFLNRGKNFDSGTSREFVYECLTEGIYNTELTLCMKGVKPVSRFIVETERHGEFLRDWAWKEGMEFDMRPLSEGENRANLNPRIRFVGYFSSTPGLVAEAMYADANAKDDFEYRVGKLLGYPECCNLAWSRRGSIPKEADRIGFFFDEYLRDAIPENNPFLNFTHRSLSFFYPCRLSCPSAAEVHLRQEAAIGEDAPEFLAEIRKYRSYPSLFVWPKSSSTLSINLHFDEVFRVHFIGKRIAPDVVAYADFFLSSLSFVDQPNESEYASACVDLLEALVFGDNVVIGPIGLTVRKWKKTIAEFPFGSAFSRAAYF